MREHHDAAPSAYPEIHRLTQPLRRAARETNDPDSFHLWAGQLTPTPSIPAATLMDELAAETAAALSAASD